LAGFCWQIFLTQQSWPIFIDVCSPLGDPKIKVHIKYCKTQHSQQAKHQL